jgi:multidrug resistance efflux pump
MKNYAIRNTQYALCITFYILLVALSACSANGTSTSSELRLSGVIEGTQVMVIAEVGGRVAEILVDEGDTVQAGQAVVKFDDLAMQAQVKQAQAGVSAAQANLAQVKAGARPEEIQVAEATIAKAQSERDGAKLTFQGVAAILDNPQQLLAQIDAARTGVKLAEQNVAVSKTKLEEARWWRNFYDSDKGQRDSLNTKIAIAQNELDAAQAQLDGAKAQLGALQAMRQTPVTLQAQANGARSAYSMTLASVPVAEAALAELKAGSTPEQIALAEAQLHQAQAQLKLAQAYSSRAILYAPIGGIIASRSAHVGEAAQPGAAILSIVNLDEITLVMYVPQTELPRIKLGTPVKVYVDAYPGETFTGAVTYIARQAQFSSRDTQEREDRANVVFAIKVRLPNSDHRLKAGMTADGVIP